MDLINLIAKSSIHLIVVDPKTIEPKSFGSGCIVNYMGKSFLLSVAHVTNYEGSQTCLETNLPPKEGKTPLYCVEAMHFFDQYKVTEPESISSVEELFSDFDKTLDITFCEIKENITLLQPKINFGAFKIESGEKAFLNFDEIGIPTKDKIYGFCGRVRQKFDGQFLKIQPTMKYPLTYGGKKGRFYYFLAPELIKDSDDYRGCSGAPILDQDGRLVALASSVLPNSKVIFAFSIQECKSLLDISLQIGSI